MDSTGAVTSAAGVHVTIEDGSTVVPCQRISQMMKPAGVNWKCITKSVAELIDFSMKELDNTWYSISLMDVN